MELNHIHFETLLPASWLKFQLWYFKKKKFKRWQNCAVSFGFRKTKYSFFPVLSTHLGRD